MKQIQVVVSMGLKPGHADHSATLPQNHFGFNRLGLEQQTTLKRQQIPMEIPMLFSSCAERNAYVTVSYVFFIHIT